MSKEISNNENERNSYAVINQLKSALKNSKNTHFGVLLKKISYSFSAENFKNGYVSSLTGFIAEKAEEYNALFLWKI